MPAINDTPQQIATLIATTATETAAPVIVTHPPLDTAGVNISFYRADPGSTPPNALHAVVTFTGRPSIDLIVANVVPAGPEMNALRLALGRVLVGAREAVGAV